MWVSRTYWNSRYLRDLTGSMLRSSKYSLGVLGVFSSASVLSHSSVDLPRNRSRLSTFENTRYEAAARHRKHRLAQSKYVFWGIIIDTFAELNLTFGIVSAEVGIRNWLCKSKWESSRKKNNLAESRLDWCLLNTYVLPHTFTLLECCVFCYVGLFRYTKVLYEFVFECLLWKQWPCRWMWLILHLCWQMKDFWGIQFNSSEKKKNQKVNKGRRNMSVTVFRTEVSSLWHVAVTFWCHLLILRQVLWWSLVTSQQ